MLPEVLLCELIIFERVKLLHVRVTYAPTISNKPKVLFTNDLLPHLKAHPPQTTVLIRGDFRFVKNSRLRLLIQHYSHEKLT